MKVITSFSGGKTSAYMTYLLKSIFGTRIIVVFMNTGLEHEETLEFVDKCDKKWGLNVQWIEAVVNHKKGIPTTFRFVTYETATRDNSIAKEVVKKYGLFGVGFLHCTREMKLQPFKAWKKESGLDDCLVAIGIRSDEADRMNDNYEKEKLFYPLIGLGVTKEKVNSFWAEQDFNLEIPERFGNCKMCWKKSDKKLVSNLMDNPEWANEIKELEEIKTKKGCSNMFRKNRKIGDLEALATIKADNLSELSGGCGESCEVF